MNAPLLRLQGLTKRYGALLVTDNVHLDVFPGEIHALIGPNGAGKTTLTGQISGLLTPDSGQIYLMGQEVSAIDAPGRSRLGLGRSFQITSVFPSMTALENVALAIRASRGHNFRFWHSADSDRQTQSQALNMLHLSGLANVENKTAATLAHGELRQLELAMALATSPQLLVLDEPMAGLGSLESQQMVKLLASFKSQYGVLLIEHDMDAVFTLADRISVLVAGRIICTGTADTIRDSQEVRQAYLGESDD